MPELIAAVTVGDDTTTEQLAGFLRYALAPGTEHVYGADDTNLAVGTITVDELELRHPDGEHYRDNDSGKFTTKAQNAAHPESTTHESAE